MQFSKGDNVRVSMSTIAEIKYVNITGETYDLRIPGHPAPVEYVPAEYLSRSDLPVRAGDTWKLNGELYQVHNAPGSLRVRNVSGRLPGYGYGYGIANAIAEFEKQNPELRLPAVIAQDDYDDRGRYAVIGVPVPAILPNTGLGSVSGALSVAQALSRTQDDPVTVIKHHGGRLEDGSRDIRTVGSFRKGERVA